MKEIKLTQNQVAIVDDEYFDLLNQFKWQYNKGYAQTSITYIKNKRTTISMHRFIMYPPKGMSVDHINHNKLDNRRLNLRVCTNSQNSRNQQTQKRNKSSQFKGVSWNKRKQKWEAYIKISQKLYHLGRFTDELEAAKAYNVAAIKYFGEFALLNEV